MRLYWGEAETGGGFAPGERIDGPAAAADFPREIVRAAARVGGSDPRRPARWTEMPRGGHFAAFEEPELLADDVVAFLDEVGLMKTVRVERTIRASADDVFEMLTDHADYVRFRGVRSAELIRRGDPDPNGTGAMRRILIGPIRFDEEITGFDRPRRMDYIIRDMNMPFEHEGGTIGVEAAGGSCHVVWESTFQSPTAVIGGAMTRTMVVAVRRGFNRILDDVCPRSHLIPPSVDFLSLTLSSSTLGPP